MKKRLLTIISVMSVLTLIFSLNGCKEEGSTDFDANIQTAQDYILCELSALDAFDIVFTSGIDSILFADGSATIENATITLDTSGDTTITIDFGRRTYFQIYYGRSRTSIRIYILIFIIDS